ncbi:hypothetical protein Tco_0045450 [Tanacetum coccineum]
MATMVASRVMTGVMAVVDGNDVISGDDDGEVVMERSGGCWPECLVPDIWGLHYLLGRVVQAGMYRDLSLRTSGPLQVPTTATITTITITIGDGMRRVRTFVK